MPITPQPDSSKALKILLTGANGYIGLRLLPSLLHAGHQVWAVVRDKARFPYEDFEENPNFHLIEADFLVAESLPTSIVDSRQPDNQPIKFDAAYYLIHSMGGGANDFVVQELAAAQQFVSWLGQLNIQPQIIYLSGLSPKNQDHLSPHFKSRRQVEQCLQQSPCPTTILRASIIVGSGSASFEIIRDLVEKLPMMICPQWTRTKCQPIGIRNVIGYLTQVLAHPDCLNQSFDIGGTDVLNYRQLLTIYAQERGLKRLIIPVPFLSPKLSAYWLYFVTSTSFGLAQALVASLKYPSICEERHIQDILPTDLLSYRQAVDLAFTKIAQNRVPSSWFDSLSSGRFSNLDLRSIHVPDHGILQDQQTTRIRSSRQKVIESVWALGGERGWPSMNWAWKLRGILDRLVGGTGIRRGRRHPSELRAGDALDFWRVLLADPDQGRLILYAEMKLPGEAWLEFKISRTHLTQTATFRPQGLLGRAYWYAVLPFHWWLFPRMAKILTS